MSNAYTFDYIVHDGFGAEDNFYCEADDLESASATFYEHLRGCDAPSVTILGVEAAEGLEHGYVVLDIHKELN